MRKRFITGLTALTLVFSSQAQSWFDLGIKAAWGPNFIYNQTVLDDINYNNVLDYGYSFGGKLGYNFNETHQVTVDIMSSYFNASFVHNKPSFNGNGDAQFDSRIRLNTLDMMLLYRSNNNGGYFEIGPKYIMLQKATFSDNYYDLKDADIKSRMNGGLFGLVVGFGGYFMGTENFGITLGGRFSYAISDLVNNTGQNEYFPTFNPEREYKGNHPFTAMLVMEFNYDLGYLAGPKCGKRKKLILF
ncbi:MAG: hypothetical protein ACK4K0_00880 [Flavobacteriales bacterium]